MSTNFVENLGDKDKKSLADKASASAPANAPYLHPCR